ncbi:MAG: putative aldose-epimerase [Frankiales bacterium]|nr:putative aldose-epimerase [Frankiales bacterium]
MQPSGEQHVIEAGSYRVVAVGVGGGLREATVDGRPLLDGSAVDALADGGRGQVLAPWPNRVRDGRWTWQGKTCQLALNEVSKGNASHGLVRWAHWSVADRGPDRVLLATRLEPHPGYPCRLDLSIGYTVHPETGLSVLLRATAVDGPAPVALGMHPYLAPPDGGLVDGCVLHAPAATRVLVDDRSLPTGRAGVDGVPEDLREPVLLGDRVLDVAYTDRASSEVTLSAGGRTTVLTTDSPWLQVFTGDTLAEGRRRRGLAVEPLTAPVDALNSGEADVLQPGETLSLAWSLRQEPTVR